MPVIMGTNLKKRGVFIAPNGQTYGSAAEYYEGKNNGKNNQMANVVAGVGQANRVAKGTKGEKKEAKIQVKQCLGCSSPAKEGSDYCSSCGLMIKK